MTGDQCFYAVRNRYSIVQSIRSSIDQKHSVSYIMIVILFSIGVFLSYDYIPSGKSVPVLSTSYTKTSGQTIQWFLFGTSYGLLTSEFGVSVFSERADAFREVISFDDLLLGACLSSQCLL